MRAHPKPLSGTRLIREWRSIRGGPTHLSRVLRLTLLAPDIVEMILDGRQPADIALAAVLQPFPVILGADKGHFKPSNPTGMSVARGALTHSLSSVSFSPSSRYATLVSSTFCGETPSAGATSTRSVSFKPAVAANFESTFV
jgi:hypothetical protein